jgi:hypothetical protein
MKVKTKIKAGKPLGDALAVFTRVTGIEWLAERYTEVTGKDCGCKKRQETLNRLFPF